MCAASAEAGWHRIADQQGCRVVWAEPGVPHASWVACFRSQQDAETGELHRALLLRTDEFERRAVARARAELNQCQ